MKYAQIKKRENIYKLGLLNSETGKPLYDKNGNLVYWQFDLDDIELTLKYNKCLNDIRNQRNKLKIAFSAIDKKKNIKQSKNILSNNDKEKIEALNQFYKEATKSMNLFLGENGVQKYLNGGTPYWEMFDDIAESLKPFLPDLNISVDNMINKIKNKYSDKNNGKVIKNEN